MPEGTTITPQVIRDFANLPSEVPEKLLQTHIAIAVRDLAEATGLDIAPSDKTQQWVEALTVCALASAFPWLNTFALNGASKVGRLEGSVEYRFLDVEEVEEKVTNLTARFDALVAQIKPVDGNDATECGSETTFGITTMIAI